MPTANTLTDHTDVEVRRSALALRAAGGDPAADAELDRIDEQIAADARRQERAALAEAEAQRVASIEQAERQAEERRVLAAAIDTAGAAQRAAYARVEASLGELLTHAQAAVTAGDDVDRLAGQLGRPNQAAGYAARQGIANRIAIKYWVTIGPNYLPAAGPDRPLVDDAASADPIVTGSTAGTWATERREIPVLVSQPLDGAPS